MPPSSDSPYSLVMVHALDKEMQLEKRKRWVFNLGYFISVFIQQMWGKRIPIHLVDEENLHDWEAKVDGATLLVAVLSESYRRHGFAMDAVLRYAERTKRDQCLYVDGKYSLFKVQRGPTKSVELFPALEPIPSYDFYDRDPLTGNVRTFSQHVGDQTEKNYWLKLVDMAYDMVHVLKQRESGAGQKKATVVPRERTVYLASVASDVMMYRDIIRRELSQRGYKVYPEHTLPARAEDIARMTREDFSKCILSIHLIGEQQGRLLAKEGTSIVALQDKVTHDCVLEALARRKQDSKEKMYHRLIWLDPSIEVVDERQRLFIENLKSEAASIEEAEVIEVPIEEFKYLVRERLSATAAAGFTGHVGLRDEADASKKYVYVMYDKRDKEDSSELASLLIDEGFHILTTPVEGTPAEMRFEHQHNLRICDASIIYMKQASDQWLGTKVQDLFKVPAFGREKPLEAKAVLLRCDIDLKLEDLERYVTILHAPNGLSRDVIRPFINKLKGI